MSNTTIGIVALDDAFGIIIFMLVSILYFSSGSDNLKQFIVNELFFSIVIGIVMGVALRKASQYSFSDDYLLPLLVGFIFVAVGLSSKMHTSMLLTCIILGLVANNLKSSGREKFSLKLPIQHIEEFIFITFFTLTGTYFSSEYFMIAAVPIILYVLARGFGKYFGAFLGAVIGRANIKTTPRLLGFTLIPQAGVAIGLFFQVAHLPEFAESKDLIFNMLLGSTILNELIGSIMTKYAFLTAEAVKNK